MRGHGRAGGQQEVNITEGNEVMFVEDFVDGEELRFGMPGPVEFRRGPVNEIAPEGFGRSEADGAILLGVGEGFQNTAQER